MAMKTNVSELFAEFIESQVAEYAEAITGEENEDERIAAYRARLEADVARLQPQVERDAQAWLATGYLMQ